MYRLKWTFEIFLLALAAVVMLSSPPSANAQLERNLKMSCIECHADPALGGFHGGFRSLIGLTEAQMEVVCLTCHDGSYTNPQGVDAPLAAVHTVAGGEFGTWKITCLRCHNNHYNLHSGDGSGNRNIKLLGNLVREASTSDILARLRRPFIFDTNGDNGGTGRTRYEDDVQQGFYCGPNPVTSVDNPCTETDPPSAGDTVRKYTFATNLVDTAQLGTNPWANNWAQGTQSGNSFLNLPVPTLAGQRWYDGACSVCHTRQNTHARRDNSGPEADRNHNLDEPTGCVKCHNHKDSFTNKK